MVAALACVVMAVALGRAVAGTGVGGMGKTAHVLHRDGDDGGVHELLWSAQLAAGDIRTVGLEVARFGNDGHADLLVTVEPRTGGPHIELRCGRTGDLYWRRLPGGAMGGTAFATAFAARDADFIVAAGALVTAVGRDGQAVSSARLPGTIRSASASAGRVCVCTGDPGGGFADTLVCLEATDDRAKPDGWNHVWSRELAGRGESFDNGFSRPVFGDVDGDGGHELLVIERMNELVCLTNTGAERWRIVLGEKNRLSPTGVASADPVIAEATGDGLPDVVVGCFAGAVVVVDGETGEELTRLQFGTESHEEHIKGRRLSGFLRDALARTGEPIGEMLAVDLDGIGGAELVFGCSDGFVYAVSPRNGGTLWRFRPERDVYDRPVIDPERDACDGPGIDLDRDTRDPPVIDPARCRRLVLWDERCLYVLDAQTGTELARLAGSCICTAAVTGWREDAVDVVIADGPSGRLEARRVRTSPSRIAP